MNICFILNSTHCYKRHQFVHLIDEHVSFLGNKKRRFKSCDKIKFHVPLFESCHVYKQYILEELEKNAACHFHVFSFCCHSLGVRNSEYLYTFNRHTVEFSHNFF
jgi:hypothetical protein